MENQNTIPDYTPNRLARYALESCREYLKDPKHQKEFEQWFLQKYGYRWKEKNRDSQQLGFSN